MPRAEHTIDSPRTDTLDTDPSSTSSLQYHSAQALQRGRVADATWGVCTCRCSPTASGGVVVGIFALIATCTVAVQRMIGSSRPPPPPPWIDLPSVAQCGAWPDYIPCYQCLYGADPAKRYRVQPGDKCAELSRKLGAPRFDLFIRNRSLSCCDTDPMPGEWIDVCDPPTRDQWKADGHPRRPQDKNVIGSFLGSASNGYVGLPFGENLSTSINVVMLFPTNDIDTKGNFVVDPKFASECDTLIDPVSPRRQVLLDSPWRNDNVLLDKRVWQFSLGTNAGRWRSISADDWGKNGAAALEKIILRYRLDGIDVNIESPQSGFANYMCALFRHLKEIDSELVITVTPYKSTLGSYNQLGSQCGDLVAWVNCEHTPLVTYCSTCARVMLVEYLIQSLVRRPKLLRSAL